MSPLAFRILKDLTLPIKRRWLKDGADLLPRMSATHCFDLTDVSLMIDELRSSIAASDDQSPLERLSFLPAPRTWLEGKSVDYQRFGIHLEDDDDGAARATLVLTNAAFPIGWIKLRGVGCGLIDPAEFASALGINPLDIPSFGSGLEGLQHWFQSWCYLALALINTPRIIGRQQHMPHRWLERELTKRMGVGKFPLLAWNEIKLQVHPPKVAGDESVEAHLTGKKALHFCRAHLRVRLGRLEYVTSHWRGDPALGIKQSRYKLVA